VKLNGTCTRPRSGLGLNELLGDNRKGLAVNTNRFPVTVSAEKSKVGWYADKGDEQQCESTSSPDSKLATDVSWREEYKHND